MAYWRGMRTCAAAAFCLVSAAAQAQMQANLGQFSDTVPGQQYYYCSEGTENSSLSMWKAFSSDGNPMGYGVRARLENEALAQLQSADAQAPKPLVSLFWPSEFGLQRHISPVFDPGNATLTISAMPRNEILREWKEGIWTQFVVDRGRGFYFWPQGPVTNVGLPIAKPALMTEPDQDRSFTFRADLGEFLAWGKDRDRLTVHKLAVARAKRMRGTITPPFGERRLLYSIVVNTADLEATAAEIVRKFSAWETGLDFKACPILTEEEDNSIVVTNGAAN